MGYSINIAEIKTPRSVTVSNKVKPKASQAMLSAT